MFLRCCPTVQVNSSHSKLGLPCILCEFSDHAYTHTNISNGFSLNISCECGARKVNFAERNCTMCLLCFAFIRRSVQQMLQESNQFHLCMYKSLVSIWKRLHRIHPTRMTHFSYFSFSIPFATWLYHFMTSMSFLKP